MIANCITISVAYSDLELRNLVEEFLVQQKSTFALKSVCSFILNWALEDGKVFFSDSKFEDYKLDNHDEQRVKCVLESIVRDGRIADLGDIYCKC